MSVILPQGATLSVVLLAATSPSDLGADRERRHCTWTGHRVEYGCGGVCVLRGSCGEMELGWVQPIVADDSDMTAVL